MYVYKKYWGSHHIPPNYCATTHVTSHCLAKTPESISVIRREEPVCVRQWDRFHIQSSPQSQGVTSGGNICKSVALIVLEMQ